jgi:hypothetical protein
MAHQKFAHRYTAFTFDSKTFGNLAKPNPSVHYCDIISKFGNPMANCQSSTSDSTLVKGSGAESMKCKIERTVGANV